MKNSVRNSLKLAIFAVMTVANGASAQETPQQQNSVDLYGVCERYMARSFDGSCNNVYSYRFGASQEQLQRKIPAVYSDGVGAMIGSEAQPSRRNPRDISNIVSAQSGDTPSVDNLNDLVYQWGQFIDHDMDLDHANDGRPEQEEPFTIAQVFGDLFPSSIFIRTPKDNSVASNKVRQQLNHISAWLDASMIYGSSIERANWLRRFEKGQLKYSTAVNALGETEMLLPYATVSGQLHDEHGVDLALDLSAPRMEGDSRGDGSRIREIFIAGDFRANEQTGLTAMHAIWLREHNRIAADLWNAGYRDDEEIYQRARRLVIGKVQKITYDEWLPALGITMPAYGGYQTDVNPNISNIFAAAAFRFGHTMLSNEVLVLNDDKSPATITANGVTLIGDVPLIHAFRGSNVIRENGANIFLKGLANATQQQVDSFMVDAIRNLLFVDHHGNALFGSDLALRNIQRGRDHGLADYATVRALVTGTEKVTSFLQINQDPSIANRLSEAYDGDINNIDAWVGMISEQHQPGFSVGPTVAAILIDQLSRIRDADFYYYKNDPFIFSDERATIDSEGLKNVLEANTGMSFNRDIFHNI